MTLWLEGETVNSVLEHCETAESTSQITFLVFDAPDDVDDNVREIWKGMKFTTGIGAHGRKILSVNVSY